MTLYTGLAASVSLTVSESDTATALGSGDVPVLGTPRVVALAEAATCAAVSSVLAAHETTVGSEIQLTHLAPTAIGSSVTADAVLESIDGRRLSFRVKVNDAAGLVAAGYVTRVLVDRARFLDKLES